MAVIQAMFNIFVGIFLSFYSIIQYTKWYYFGLIKVTLGLLFKNENLNDEMVEILEELHDKYVPLRKAHPDMEDDDTEVYKAVFFGGDQLTEERARNSQNSRGEGDTTFERLEGIIPKVEDWHAIRLVYQVNRMEIINI